MKALRSGIQTSASRSHKKLRELLIHGNLLMMWHNGNSDIPVCYSKHLKDLGNYFWVKICLFFRF